MFYSETMSIFFIFNTIKIKKERALLNLGLSPLNN